MSGDARKARQAAKTQWSRHPAGTTLVEEKEGTRAFFERMTEVRYQLQPWHPALLRKFSPAGRLLEIGCGAGTDHAELASMVDSSVGVDLAYKGAWLTRQRMLMEERRGRTLVADGEELPFASASFDCVYSCAQ
jgi:ubiquinone/menaquinone biosynthesis C-methylase UbiE